MAALRSSARPSAAADGPCGDGLGQLHRGATAGERRSDGVHIDLRLLSPQSHMNGGSGGWWCERASTPRRAERLAVDDVAPDTAATRDVVGVARGRRGVVAAAAEVAQVEARQVLPAQDGAVIARRPERHDFGREGHRLEGERGDRRRHRRRVRRPANRHVRLELIEDVGRAVLFDVGNLLAALGLGQRVHPRRHALVGHGQRERLVHNAVGCELKAVIRHIQHRKLARGVRRADLDAARVGGQAVHGARERVVDRVFARVLLRIACPLGEVQRDVRHCGGIEADLVRHSRREEGVGRDRRAGGAAEEREVHVGDKDESSDAMADPIVNMMAPRASQCACGNSARSVFHSCCPPRAHRVDKLLCARCWFLSRF